MLPRPDMHMVFDEIESFRLSHAARRDFRVRVWRGMKNLFEELPAVALVGATSSEGGMFRSHETIQVRSQAANFVYQAVIGYADAGLIYFEHDPPVDGFPLVIRRVSFSFYGNRHRMRLYNPVELPNSSSLATIDHFVGPLVTF